jgi:hypothetical protein
VDGETVTAMVAGLPDPTTIQTLHDLADALTKLRRLAASGRGTDKLSARAVARLVHRPHGALNDYLGGKKLMPNDTYEAVLLALGIAAQELRPWLDAWWRVADVLDKASSGLTNSTPALGAGPHNHRTPSAAVSQLLTFLYGLESDASERARIGIVTGDIRRVRNADVWVNPENTDMEMSRHNDYSISAVIRFDGAHRDPTGRVVDDLIAEELRRKVNGRTPISPATVIATASGRLADSNQVRHVLHVAAVRGEPGGGYRQVIDIGRCATNVLREVEHLAETDPTLGTILVPLLGVGAGGAEVAPTVTALIGATIDHLTAGPCRVRTVLFLAHTEEELAVCRAIFDTHPRLCRLPVLPE